MKTLRMYDLLDKRFLVTRASARAFSQELAAALAEGYGEVALDFSGVEGLTPSFLDEILTVIEECVSRISEMQPRVTITNSPTQLSSKFALLGKGHNLAIKESSN